MVAAKKARALANRTVRSLGLVTVLFLFMGFTTGCLYPAEKRADNQAAYRESTVLVQNAVDAYQKDNTLLPIKNSSQDTPKFEKFRINFDELIGRGYLSTIPPSAFEKGGSAYYLIINEETNPTVKVMDLVTAQQMNDLQKKVNQYITQHDGSLPKGEQAYPGYYTVDLNQLSGKINLKSVYSGEPAHMIMNEKGTVYVDYAEDIMKAIQKSGKTPTEKDNDLRDFLVEASYFVPVKSVAYHWSNNQPEPAAE